MATRETNVPYYCDTNTLIRAYCAEIKTGMLAMNWLQTTDTGQLDPTTVVVATALDQDLGYLMFKMNDTLQATNPVFLKLTIGAIATASVNSPISPGQSYYVTRIKVQIGTATNGAGTFTGFKISQERRMTVYITTASPTNGTPTAVTTADLHLWCGDTNRVLMARGMNGSALTDGTDPFGGTPPAVNTSFRCQSFFSVERSKDSAGVDTNDGIIFFAAGNIGENTTAYFHEYIPFNRPIPQHRHKIYWPCFCLGDSSYVTALNYNQLTAFPMYPFEGGAMKNPGMNQLGYWINDFQYGGTATPITIYAASHLYRPITQDAFRPMLGSTSNMHASARMMIRWE